MSDSTEKIIEKENTDNNITTALTVNTTDLNKESLELINQIIAEPDVEKTQDLTYLFNINQNKKTIVRVNKLNDLLDAITDQAVVRFTTKPDEISNKELMDGLKTVSDLIEKSQNQVVNGNEQQPLIQINQQNNSVNVGQEGPALSRDSREKVKNVVMDLLNVITKPAPETQVVDAEVNEQPQIESEVTDMSGNEPLLVSNEEDD